MRSQVDAAVEVVASPGSGASANDLQSALLRWPHVVDLTLLNVGSTSDLAPLSTATLAGLASLTVRQARPPAGVQPLAAWSLSAFSSKLGATLRVLDLSGCDSLSSIDGVHSCVQLRCLHMPGCVSVSDLSPLAACSQTLQELWMASDALVQTLVPLASCLKLRKLDLQGCRPVLNTRVAGLQLTCTQLAAPSTVELQGLVHELQLNLAPDMKVRAAVELRRRNREGGLEAQTAIAAAGAIPALAQLLGTGYPAQVQEAAVGALNDLARNHAENQAVIAGAAPALVQLLGPESSAGVKQAAADVLLSLSRNHDSQTQAILVTAGMIPAVVKLLGPNATAESSDLCPCSCAHAGAPACRRTAARSLELVGVQKQAGSNATGARPQRL
ncbi:hypothetical protein FOA52_014354 [Chlamydomonas sp. UWO 241]|nr:hypothetical protein FOA52_014354 [Chlamydomonas sp. UWO 241]